MSKTPYKTSLRQLSLIDRLLIQGDHALRTIAGAQAPGARPSPAKNLEEAPLGDAEREHAAGLMRVNHSGEVCAQALYQGQALTASLPGVRAEMEMAAEEEIDHLQWCEERLDELHSRPSIFNPLWYALSFGIGAGAGLISDRISLGFVAATEDQVCAHLEDHLQTLPPQDQKSRSVVEQMLVDERKHGHAALGAGGARFPGPVKMVMTGVSKVMTTISYRL
jgi:ubiquinone biosynthesis monooxygenase Coq7